MWGGQRLLRQLYVAIVAVYEAVVDSVLGDVDKSGVRDERSQRLREAQSRIYSDTVASCSGVILG